MIVVPAFGGETAMNQTSADFVFLSRLTRLTWFLHELIVAWWAEATSFGVRELALRLLLPSMAEACFGPCQPRWLPQFGLLPAAFGSCKTQAGRLGLAALPLLRAERLRLSENASSIKTSWQGAALPGSRGSRQTGKLLAGRWAIADPEAGTPRRPSPPLASLDVTPAIRRGSVRFAMQSVRTTPEECQLPKWCGKSRQVIGRMGDSFSQGGVRSPVRRGVRKR